MSIFCLDADNIACCGISTSSLILREVAWHCFTRYVAVYTYVFSNAGITDRSYVCALVCNLIDYQGYLLQPAICVESYGVSCDFHRVTKQACVLTYHLIINRWPIYGLGDKLAAYCFDHGVSTVDWGLVAISAEHPQKV